MYTKQNNSAENFEPTQNRDALPKQPEEKLYQPADANLKFRSGKENEPLTRLQTTLNKKRKEVIDFINNARLERA